MVKKKFVVRLGMLGMSLLKVAVFEQEQVKNSVTSNAKTIFDTYNLPAAHTDKWTQKDKFSDFYELLFQIGIYDFDVL